jgi:hypothetical protein
MYEVYSIGMPKNMLYVSAETHVATHATNVLQYELFLKGRDETGNQIVKSEKQLRRVGTHVDQ